MIKKFKSVIYKLVQIIPYAGGTKKSYFSGDEKVFVKKVIDLLSWNLRDREFNHNYYSFGLNLKKRDQKFYIGRTEFLKKKDQIEFLLRKTGGSENIYYDVITKDKFVSFAYFSTLGIPCIPVMGLADKDGIVFTGGKKGPLKDIFEIKDDFVLKNILLESGDGFMLCKPLSKNKMIINQKEMNLQQLKTALGKHRWVLQNRVRSHEAIRRINDTALNTTRIVTILNGRQAIYLCGFQSFATGEEVIDTWGKGSLYVGFDPDKSILTGPGYFHPEIKGQSLADQHPDSDIGFNGYKIPFLKESVELCMKAHNLLYNNFVVGWDVVITDKGPLILEANEKPGMNAVQCVVGGLRFKIKTNFLNTLKFVKDQL